MHLHAHGLIGLLLILLTAINAGAQEISNNVVPGSTLNRPITSFETLSGDLPKNLNAKSKPYLVTADIFVPSGKTVTIGPGVVLLFKNFVGLYVEGQLIAEGSKEKPIILTSELDNAYASNTTLSANPYDWNGVFIHEGGLASSLAYCTIRFSVFGINSLTRFIRLDKVLFSDNGRADLTIEGEKKTVGDEPISYASSIKDAKDAGVPVTLLMDPNARKRNVLRYSGLGLCVAGAASSFFLKQQLDRDQDRVNFLKDPTIIDNTSPWVKYSSEDFEAAVSKRNADILLIFTSIGLSALAATGFFVSFTF